MRGKEDNPKPERRAMFFNTEVENGLNILES
jgi:hypothetical protein